MKAKIVPIAGLFIFLSIILTSCEETVYKVYTGNSPVYMSYEELRSSVEVTDNAQLKNPGKIYFKDNYIFIIEEQEGIHIYDNTNPVSPVKKKFIKIPGVVDISIAGNTLYADSYIDMLVFSVADINNISLQKRVEDILPYAIPPTDNDYPTANIERDKGVVVGWQVKRIRERFNEPVYPYPIYMEKGAYFDILSNGASSGVSGSGVGIGGSMARFGIKGDVLYVLSQYEIKVFDITTKTNPVSAGQTWASWDAETMFLTDKYMYIGTSSGMVIYDISIPLVPVYKTFFSHARACDPVIVEDTLAYITLRTGTTCGGSANTLSVVDVKDVLQPKPVMVYPMTNPHGLGKDGDLLFICDGSAGLKIYNASDPKTITSHLVKAYPGIQAFDVIPVNGLLIMIGDQGLFQYDYSDVMNITLLGSIAIPK